MYRHFSHDVAESALLEGVHYFFNTRAMTAFRWFPFRGRHKMDEWSPFSPHSRWPFYESVNFLCSISMPTLHNLLWNICRMPSFPLDSWACHVLLSLNNSIAPTISWPGHIPHYHHYFCQYRKLSEHLNISFSCGYRGKFKPPEPSLGGPPRIHQTTG